MSKAVKQLQPLKVRFIRKYSHAINSLFRVNGRCTEIQRNGNARSPYLRHNG